MKRRYFLYAFLVLFLGCQDQNNTPSADNFNLTIFTINDIHGQLENFAKVKYIVDKAKENSNVLFVSAGDIFSGNPVVDSHEDKGYPIIDLMNKVGVDVNVAGNHEYDYGEEHLKNRIEQAEFEFICANVNTSGSLVPQPEPYMTLTVGESKIVILGLVETNGSDQEIIPSTHPWRVQNLSFMRPESVVGQYEELKTQEDADLYVALTHIGHNGNDYELGDFQLANKFPFFDIIIGGHSHWEIDTIINGIPIFQTGSYLHNLGQIDLSIKDKKIVDIRYKLIDLDAFTDEDVELVELIDTYNDQPYLNEVIGYSHAYHSESEVGCFYTEAMRGKMAVDIAFQNTGGVRAGLNEGDIIKREIYEIAPFNNGTVIYTMSVAEIKAFLKGSASGFYYSGGKLSQNGNSVVITDLNDVVLSDDVVLKVGVNDYTAAVHASYFPANGEIQDLTTAETMISFLLEIDDQVDLAGCNRYFRYD